jgi:putative ABC transport system permease protein
MRTSLRALLTRPGVTMLAIVTLALGIGANTAMFTVANAVLVRPLPYPDADRLVAIWSSPIGARNKWTSAYPDVADWRASLSALDGLAAFRADRATLRRGSDPQLLVGVAASSDLFRILGVEPERGRVLTADDDRLGAAPAVVLSHEAWQEYFDADPQIVGRAIPLADQSVTVVGVMPPLFKFPIERVRVDYYLPLAVASGEKITHRSDMFLRAIGRLSPRASVDQAQAELASVASRLGTAYPDTNATRTAWVTVLRDDLVGDVRPVLLMLQGAVLLVLLIACANVANLLLASASARRIDIAVRAALGASRARLAMLSLVDSGVLALAGGLAGWLLSGWVIDALQQNQPNLLPRLASASPDGRVLLLSVTTAAVVTLAAGLLPALQHARADVTDALKSMARGSSEGGRGTRARSTLVVVQVALSVALVLGAGLLLRSVGRLSQIQPGFDARDVSMTALAPALARFPTPDQRNRYFARVVDELTRIPGIESAAAITPMPFSGNESDTNFSIVGQPPAPRGQEPLADYRVAGAEYFRVMKIPVVAGRAFKDGDRAASAPVAIVNEAFVRRFLSQANPLDQSLVIGADPKDNPNPAPRRVVGDASHTALDAPPVPEMYVPLMQEKWPTMEFVWRARPGSAAAVASSARDAIRRADAGEYVGEPRPMERLLAQSLARRQFTLELLGAFAALALVLASIGMYGVMAQAVTSRTREFGIRMAIGAQRIDIVRLVLRQGLVLAAAGLGAGLTGARLLAPLLSRWLFGVAPTDALTFLIVPVIVAAAILAACAVPARRATRVDPIVAVRAE